LCYRELQRRFRIGDKLVDATGKTASFSTKSRIDHDEPYPFEEDWPKDEALSAGCIAVIPAITAILMAAFPEWFTRKKDPVRTVWGWLSKRGTSEHDQVVSEVGTRIVFLKTAV
jgi:hypothetical protein